MSIESVTVDGTQYNIASASAVDQKRMLHMMGTRLVAVLGEDITAPLDAKLVFGSLLTLKEAEFDAVAKLALYKTMVNGGSELITIADFQDEIMNYYMLVAEAVVVNLSSFLCWLDRARQPEPAKATQGEKEMTT